MHPDAHAPLIDSPLIDSPPQETMTEQDVYKLALQLAQDIAPRYGLDVVKLARFTTAVVNVETGRTYNPSLKNKTSSARGLMQVLSCTQRWMEEKLSLPFAPQSVALGSSCKQYAKKNPPQVSPDKDRMYEPGYNMRIGMMYAAYQLKRYGQDERKAAHAYNQGSFNGSSAGSAYASTVLSRKSGIDFAAHERSFQDVYAEASRTRHYEFR